MTEYEILDLLGNIRATQAAIIAQIVSLHLVMIVGIFYFLHRSGLRMKLAVLVLYSLGYALHLGLIAQMSAQIVGARADFADLLARNGELTGMGAAMFELTTTTFTNWVSIVANISFVALWFGTAYFLFFWKRPQHAEGT